MGCDGAPDPCREWLVQCREDQRHPVALRAAGFDRVDTDEREIDSKGLRFSWTKVENGDATALRDELVSRATDTVFDWPYTPPGRFALVLALQAAGVPVWWFDADPEAAKQSFDARAQGNLKNPQQGIQANFASLRRGIESWHTVLLHLYGRRFLRTLFAGGTRMPLLRIWDTLCAVEGWTP